MIRFVAMLFGSKLIDLRKRMILQAFLNGTPSISSDVHAFVRIFMLLFVVGGGGRMSTVIDLFDQTTEKNI